MLALAEDGNMYAFLSLELMDTHPVHTKGRVGKYTLQTIIIKMYSPTPMAFCMLNVHVLRFVVVKKNI